MANHLAVDFSGWNWNRCLEGRCYPKSQISCLGNELGVAGVTGDRGTGLMTHLLFCLHSPTWSQILPLLLLGSEESKTETHPTLLLQLILLVKPVLRRFAEVKQAYYTEQNHISGLILQFWWLRDTEFIVPASVCGEKDSSGRASLLFMFLVFFVCSFLFSRSMWLSLQDTPCIFLKKHWAAWICLST